MKRTLSVLLIIAFLLCGCESNQQHCNFCGAVVSAEDNFCGKCGKEMNASCPVCGAGPIADADFCINCGHRLTTDPADTQPSAMPSSPTGATIPQQVNKDAAIIERAVCELIDYWAEISNKKLEIKNTRIICLDPEQVNSLTGYSAECIVEFLIYVDYWGLPEYYDDPVSANNVIFYADGSCEIASNIAERFISNIDFPVESLVYSIVDYGESYNQVWDLYSKTQTAKASVPVTDEDENKIETARYILLNYWHGLYSENDWGARDSYFAIRNTRIVWVKPDTQEGIPAECIVEFEIAMDYYGIPQYYADPKIHCNVVFYTNGKAAVGYDTVPSYILAGGDFTELNATVKDFGSAFNSVYDLNNRPNPPSVDQPLYDFDYYILDSGYCNNNIRWEIRSNGLLYVYGRGAIPNYESGGSGKAPWRESPVYSLITDVAMSNDISGIGEYAFQGLKVKTFQFGHNVLIYDTHSWISAETAFIPDTMTDEAISYFLYDTYSRNGMTIYYEGTQEQWEQIKALNNINYDFSNYTVYFECQY